MTFRRLHVVAAALLIAASIAGPAFAQTNQNAQAADKRKFSKEETAQFKALHDQVDAVQAGKQPATTNVKFNLRPYFLRSATLIYVPYTATVDPALTAYPVALYVRAVAKGAAAPKPAEVKREPKVGDPDAPAPPPPPAPTYAFEDVYFINSAPATPGELSRAMQLAPGDYDVYYAFSERPSKDKKAAPAKSVVFVQPLTVPNLMTGFTTSTVIVAKSVEPAKGDTQMTGQQQLEHPYTVSGYEITPVAAPTFSKAGELLWAYYIYNEGANAGGKPDLHVEYNFFRAGEDKPFVNMPPSDYNSTTLPAEFDLSKGHMVFVAQGVPLTTFNPGDYKVQIKITDKTNNQVVTRDVPFTVTP